MEKPNLKALQKESFDMHTDIIAELNISKRRALMQKHGKILTKIRILESERMSNMEKTAKKDLTTLLTENLQFLVVAINGNKQRLDDSLKVELVFKPCGHTKTIGLQELLRSYEFHQGRRTPCTERNLLMKWELLFQMSSTAQGSQNCVQCQKERKSLKAKFSRWTTRPIGTVRFSVGKMH